MKIMQSMRGQIALGVSVMLVVLWLLAVLGSAYVIKGEINESFDAALQETGERILPLAVVELTGAIGAERKNRVLPLRSPMKRSRSPSLSISAKVGVA